MAVPENNVNEKLLRWIDKNRDLFGQKILCIGTGRSAALHIARAFPASSVVCLTEEAAVETAADSAGNVLRGPLWIRGDAESYTGGQFDTVAACRLEPLLPPSEEDKESYSGTEKSASGDTSGSGAPAGSSGSGAVREAGVPRRERGTFYLRCASLLMEYFEKDARTLRRHLRPGGMLLHFVQSEQDEVFLGYCLALAAEEMEIDVSGIRQILCRADGERLVCQSFAARAGGRTQIQALIARNLNFSLDRMNTSGSEYEGRDARIFLQADAGTLLRGYHIYQGTEFRGKLGVYTSVRNPDAIYYYTDVAGDVPYVRRFHIQDQKTVIRHMVGELHRQKAADKTIRWRELELHEDWSETEV